jgi:hypothetical protein
MIVLDSDITTILEDDPVRAPILEARIVTFDPDARIAVTTIEERYKGRIAACSKARTAAQYEKAARLLHRTHSLLKEYPVLFFDAAAGRHFDVLRQLKLHIGT